MRILIRVLVINTLALRQFHHLPFREMYFRGQQPADYHIAASNAMKYYFKADPSLPPGKLKSIILKILPLVRGNNDGNILYSCRFSTTPDIDKLIYT